MENEEILKLEAKIKKLKEQNDLGELALNYSILADLCKVKASEVLEGGIKLEEIKDWKKKADKYKQLKNETLSKLRINKQFIVGFNVFEELDEVITDTTNKDNAFQRVDDLRAKVDTLEIEIKRILTHLDMKTNKEAYQDIMKDLKK